MPDTHTRKRRVWCNAIEALVPGLQFSESQSDLTKPHLTAKQWTLREFLVVVRLKLSSSSLKQKQKEAAILSKRDVFVVLPTGFGKSICYEILPIVFDSLLNTFVQAQRYTIDRAVVVVWDCYFLLIKPF